MAKILLIDDDELVSDCISAFLNDDDFDVTVIKDAETALFSIGTIKPEICITDMRLKGMNGEQFILKAYTISPETHYIIHTGGGFTLTPELCNIGMTQNDILYKPLMELSRLSSKLRDILGTSA